MHPEVGAGHQHLIPIDQECREQPLGRPQNVSSHVPALMMQEPPALSGGAETCLESHSLCGQFGSVPGVSATCYKNSEARVGF